MLNFKIARAAEHDAIYQLMESAFTTYVQKLRNSATAGPYPWLKEAIANETVFVGIQKNEIVAAVTTTRKDDLLSINQIAVHPERQGKGIGKWMLKEIETLARNEGATRLTLHTGEIMLDLLRLYKHFGFRETHKALPDHGEDAHLRVHMEKLL